MRFMTCCMFIGWRWQIKWLHSHWTIWPSDVGVGLDLHEERSLACCSDYALSEAHVSNEIPLYLSL